MGSLGGKPDISVELALENEKFKRELQESVGMAERSLGGLASVAGTAGKALAGLGAGLALGELASFVADGIKAAESMGKLAQRAGVTTEEFSRLAYAAGLADISAEQLQASMTMLGRKADEAARGGQGASEAFARLGVAVRNGDGSLRGVEALFTDVADAIAKLPDGAQKSAAAMALLGRGGAQLVPLLNEGRAGLAAFGDEAARLGLVIDRETAEAADRFGDELDKMKAAATGLSIQIGSDLLPALTRIAENTREAYEESGALYAILVAIGSIATSPFEKYEKGAESLAEKSASLRKEIAALQQEIDTGLARPDSRGVQRELTQTYGRGGVDEIEVRKKQLQDYRNELAATIREQMKLLKPDTAASGGASAPKVVDESAAKSAANERERIAKAQQAALDSLRKQLELQGENNELAKIEADIRFGSAREFDNEAQKTLRHLADKIDLLNEEAEVHEYLVKLERDRREEAARTEAARGAERQRVIESLRTPEEDYSAEVNKLLELGIAGEDLQRGIDRARESLLAARDTTKETGDAARELGFAFESAFEAAVLEADSFKDVLKGLAEDLLKIGLRETVTEPLAQLLGSALGGAAGGGGGGGIGALFGDLLGGLFGNANGGLYRVGGSGTSERPVMLTAQAGEGIAVGRFAQGGGGGNTVVNVINPPAQPSIRETMIDGEKRIDIMFEGSLGRSMGRGKLAAAGLQPPLASR